VISSISIQNDEPWYDRKTITHDTFAQKGGMISHGGLEAKKAGYKIAALYFNCQLITH
jgi:hypothetical protein